MTSQTENFACDLQALKGFLTALPPVARPMTKREVVARLAPAIEEARRKGYNLREITEQLQAHGLQIAYSTVRNCLPYQRRKKRKPPAARPVTSTVPEPVACRARGAPAAPAKSAEPASSTPARRPLPARPQVPENPVFPPGATFIPIGNGEFLPAPDTEDL